MPLVPASSRGGGSGALALSQSVAVGAGGQATIDFQTIDQSGHTLVIEAVLQDTAAAGFALVTLNNDSGANYNYQRLLVQSGTATATQTTADTRVSTLITGSTPGGSQFALWRCEIPGYTSTGFHKVGRVWTFFEQTGPTEGLHEVGFRWASTAAVTRVTLTSSTLFAQNSVAYLYLLT